MTVFEARNHFAKTLEAAKKDVIIVTRNGRPVAAIQAIDDDDIEDLLLERSERFWAMIDRARRGKPVAIEALRKQVTRGRPAAKRRKRAGRAGRAT
jgi:prevent-host-death family protein